MTLRQNLLNALSERPARWVNFQHHGRTISPFGFFMLATLVNAGTVRTSIDRSITGRMAFYDPGSNTIIASDPGFGERYWDEKALLIHESAHAILDAIYAGRNSSGIRAPMRVVDDEMIGYLAGAFYLVAANAHNSSRTAPEREAIRVARSKLNPRPSWTGTSTFTFTAQELLPLRNAIISSPLYRRDALRIATHNG